MRVRAQMSMLFHLDKCIGCHTCSVACKNLWTDREGAEYMWWNNVETRPGTGYPTGWEDQDHYKGGWHRDEKGRLKLVLHSKAGGLGKLFYNPSLPELDDYYDPFTFKYGDLFDAPH
ncbi:MAG: nitrate reductase subunit beta, partial [Acidimicrobiales bacterium]